MEYLSDVVKKIDLKILFIALAIFIFSITIRLWNLNAMGRWSDEPALIEKGYIMDNLIKNKDFSNIFWYTASTDHPPLSMYFYGLASSKDFIKYDKNLASSFWNHKGAPVFTYDLTYSRLVSVLVSSIAILLLFFIGLRYFSLFVGTFSSIVLAVLPHFLAYSQLVTYESWVMLIFTACTFSYFLYLEKNNKFFLILTGILTGLALGIKESTIVVFGLYLGVYLIWRYLGKKKTINFWHILQIILIAFITFILICPMPWFHLPEYASNVYNLWFKNEGLIPELIFGRRMGAHFFYYPLALLITTPVVILILAAMGLKASYNYRKQWIFLALIIWFFAPFLMILFHHRQHMVRYIIEIYAPLCLLSAIGLEYLFKKFTKNILIKCLLVFAVFIYLISILISHTPFYLSYYNELVGGTKNVYEKKLFLLGWLGEGLKNPGIYIAKNAAPNSRIGIAIDPPTLGSVYQSSSMKYEIFNSKHTYDYVVVNYYNIIRIDFNEDILKKDYKLIYTENAGGADYVHIFKHK